MIGSEPGRTAVLAAFLAKTPAGELPDRLFDLACRCVVDTIGVVRFGAVQPWSQLAAAQGRRTLGPVPNPGRGPCTVIGHDWKATPPVAAFVNGAAGHAFELDDVHDETIMHPGTVVIPAALAVAEETGATGERFLHAVIMGYEAAARAGLAVNPKRHMLRGFHPTGTMGVFGSAAAAGVLLGLDADALRDALGIAASSAGGIMEFSRSGGMVKRLHGGRAAESGVQAAYLARDGFEGPASGLDGRFGFCNTFSDDPHPDMLVRDLGARFMIDEITVKPYACCSDVHPIVDALLAIRLQPGLDIDDIRAIEIEAPTKVAEQNALDGTTSIMAAQYSARFNAAAALRCDIQDPRLYTEEALRDPRLRALHDKVEIRSAAEFDVDYAWKIGARVAVRTGTGVFEETVCGARGSIHDPLSGTEVEDKFRNLCRPLYGERRCGEVIEEVRTLRIATSLHGLAGLLANA